MIRFIILIASWIELLVSGSGTIAAVFRIALGKDVNDLIVLLAAAGFFILGLLFQPLRRRRFPVPGIDYR